MEKLERIINELEHGLVFTISFIEAEGHEKCYDLWFVKEDNTYYLQEIYMENGTPDEVGETFSYHKAVIIRKLTEFAECKQFVIREWNS